MPLAPLLFGGPAYNLGISQPAFWAGGDGTALFDVFKVSGLSYGVTFDSNLGALSPLEVDASALPGSAPAVTTLVGGVLPSGTPIPNLPTGLAFHTKVSTHT